MTVSVEVHPPEAWADAVAADLIGRLAERPHMRLVLPTGETPAPLFRALVRDSPPGLWESATVIQLDEYLGLEADDPAAGAGRLRRELLDAVRVGRFVAVDPAHPDPELAARSLDLEAAEGTDLALLGLGMNGHVGLNEPGSDAGSPTRVVSLEARSRDAAAGYGAARPPGWGITLGVARLLEAAEIWLLVTGARKAEVLRAAIEGPETVAVPASFLRRHPRLRILADDGAARLLRAG